MGLDRSLDQLHALGDGTHLFFQESVELVETPQRTTPNKTYEDATHRLEVNALVAIENDLPIEARSERLHSLGFPCASRIVRVSSVAQAHAMHEGQVTLVGQGCLHQLAPVLLVLEGITVFALQHSDERWFLIRCTVCFQVVSQLPEPVPLRCPLNLMAEKVVHDSNVVDQIQDQRLEFNMLQILIKLKGGEIRQLLL